MRRIAVLWCGMVASWTAFAMASPSPQASIGNQLKIHEWGTFTVLQDEQGRAIAGVNTDDEPLPAFVHNLDSMLVQTPTEVPTVYFKGAPRSESDVYARLETPVIYFHPPSGYNHKLDVDVAFHGGWLTQYYPDAQVDAPGLRDGRFLFGTLTDHTIGRLGWHNLQIGTNQEGPRTDEPVWLAPRNVAAANVTTEGGESDRFLFYRGVAHFKTPLQVSRTADGLQFELRADFSRPAQVDQRNIGPLWLVDVRPDGKRAMRYVPQIALASLESDNAPKISATFTDAQYTLELTDLRQTMRDALMHEGLYQDEAEALLNTWEVSYFKRPGLRLFYMVPQSWTDQVLPLSVRESGTGESAPAQIRRVMVGRVELVTPEQRRRLGQIAQGPASDPAWLGQALEALGGGRADMYREDWYKKIMDGKQPLHDLHIRVPADYRAYLSLGRFRNALILDEANRRPTAALRQFIQAYDLSPSPQGS